MQVTINKKDYELNFGFGFLEYLNNNFGVVTDNFQTKAGGLLLLQTGLELKDPTALAKVLKAGLITENSVPTQKDIEQFINDLAEKGKKDYLEFYNEVHDELKKAPLLKVTLSALQVNK